MLSLLTEDEQKLVTKQDLIDLEEQILALFGFDFTFPGPV